MVSSLAIESGISSNSFGATAEDSASIADLRPEVSSRKCLAVWTLSMCTVVQSIHCFLSTVVGVRCWSPRSWSVGQRLLFV